MSGYKSITGETLSRIPTLAAMAEAELNHCDPSIMARMEIGLKACDGIESLLTLLVESGMISTCKLAISKVIRCETCEYFDKPCSHMSDISDFCSAWEPIRERGEDAV